MRIRLVAAASAAALLLTACGGNDSDSGKAGSDAGGKIASSDATHNEGDEGDAAEIVDYAFTQDGEYIKGIALVRANSEDAVGKFVTVSYNVLDAGGQILATEQQIETFSWVGQEIGFPFFVSLDATPNAKAARVDPVVSVGDDSFDEKYDAELPVLEAQSVLRDKYGNGYTVSFGFTNETSEPLEGLRVAAVCFNKAGKVIGGETTYPDAAPGRAIRIDIEYLMTVGDKKPATCKGYLNYPAL